MMDGTETEIAEELEGNRAMNSSETRRERSSNGSLRSKVFIAVMLFLTFVWTGSIPGLALAVTMLLAGYAYLSRRQVGKPWVALPLAFSGFWLVALVISQVQ